MKSFEARIAIDAAPSTVWDVLTDAARYPDWNRTVTGVDGRIAAGESITVHAKIAPGRAFPLSVTTFDAPARMVWTGGMPFGLFTGERTFDLTATGPGQTAFTMREVYRGALAALIGRSIPDLQPAFDEFALCLKAKAESVSSS